MNRRKIRREHKGELTVELYQSHAPHEIFFEGVHGFTLEGDTVRMELFTSGEESTADCLHRDLAGRLVMPAASFVNFATVVSRQALHLTAMLRACEAAIETPATPSTQRYRSH